MNRFLTLLLAASCLNAAGQSEYCLEGTVWDEALQGCVPESVACEVEFDYDGDGYVGSGDLLAFLTAFGASFPDQDADGLCDDIDECVGEYDECGVCNGPGAVYDCGCEECNQFTCGDTVNYQGHDYKTVLVEGQCWFAENVVYQPTEEEQDSGSMWYPSDFWGAEGECAETASPDTELAQFYGAYYSQEAINNWELCPDGWRVPEEKDFARLLHVPGYELRDTASLDAGLTPSWPLGWIDDCYPSPNGFNARPAGVIGRGEGWCYEYMNFETDGGYLYGGSEAFFGFRQEYPDYLGKEAFAFNLSGCEEGEMYRQCYPLYSPWGFSMRCVLDEDVVLEGCTSELASNFDPLAEVDDGSCVFDVVYGDSVTFWEETYATVIIGEAEWFAEDLRTRYFSNGDALPSPGPYAPWFCEEPEAAHGPLFEIGAFCGEYYTLNSYCAIALVDPLFPGFSTADSASVLTDLTGHLYHISLVEDDRNLCPSGWHPSSDSDWKELELLLGMTENVVETYGFRGLSEGRSVKGKDHWRNNGNGLDAMGLAFKPGGWNLGSGTIGDVFNGVQYFSLPTSRRLMSDENGIERAQLMTMGHVRCVKD